MEVEIEATNEEESPKKYGKYEEYEIKNAARTLVEAEEIKADAEKMKYVKQCMDKDMEAIKKAASSIGSLDELKSVAKKKLQPKY